MGVYVVAFRGLVSDGDRGVVASVAEASRAVASRAVASRAVAAGAVASSDHDEGGRG